MNTRRTLLGIVGMLVGVLLMLSVQWAGISTLGR